MRTNSKVKKTRLHKYKCTPSTSHNSGPGSVLLSDKNHHPELDLLTSGEDPGGPSLEPSTSAKLTTLTDDTSDLSSSTSLTSRRYAQKRRRRQGRLRMNLYPQKHRR